MGGAPPVPPSNVLGGTGVRSNRLDLRSISIWSWTPGLSSHKFIESSINDRIDEDRWVVVERTTSFNINDSIWIYRSIHRVEWMKRLCNQSLNEWYRCSLNKKNLEWWVSIALSFVLWNDWCNDSMERWDQRDESIARYSKLLSSNNHLNIGNNFNLLDWSYFLCSNNLSNARTNGRSVGLNRLMIVDLLTMTKGHRFIDLIINTMKAWNEVNELKKVLIPSFIHSEWRRTTPEKRLY